MKFKVRQLNENEEQSSTLFNKAEICEDVITEDKTVKFDGQVNPKFGWCTIICGGSGVGKSTVFNHLIPISAKKFDVDDLKQYTLSTSEIDGDKLILNNGEKIDLSGIKGQYTLDNPEFNSIIHQATKPFAKKVKQSIFDMASTANPDRLPNIVFDITGSSMEDFQTIIANVKPLGYKIAVVWVLGDIERAITQNKMRGRQVSIDTVIRKHSNSFNTIMNIFSDKEMVRSIDEFWVILQILFNPKDKDDVQRYINFPNVYKINSKKDVINLPNRVQSIINKQRQAIAQRMIDLGTNAD